MPTAYPGANDVFAAPTSPATTTLSSAGDSTRNHSQSHQDLGDAIVALQKNAAPIAHDHSNTESRPTAKLKQANTHQSVDTDTAGAIHHTIGSGANQSAAGNHSHTTPDITAIPNYNNNTVLERRPVMHRSFKNNATFLTGGLSTTTWSVMDFFEFTPSATSYMYATLGAFGYCSAAGSVGAGVTGQWLIRFTLEATNAYGTYLYDAQKLWSLACTVATNNVRPRTYGLWDVSASAVLSPSQKYRIACWAMQDPNATAPLTVDQLSWHVFETKTIVGA